MAKVRSPNYPSLSLGPALESVRTAFQKDNRNKMSRSVLAKHLGYSSLNGRALAKLGAVRAYGLVDGSGDELRVSDDAVAALNAPKDSTERSSALSRMALKPTLFADIRKQFPDTLPSVENLAYWLVTQGFTNKAAEKAAQSYLSTMALVAGKPSAYSEPDDSDDEEEASVELQNTDQSRSDTGQKRHITMKADAGRYDLTGGEVKLDPAPYRILLDGNMLTINAKVDLKGLLKLKEVLNRYEGILKFLAQETDAETMDAHIEAEAAEQRDGSDDLQRVSLESFRKR